MLRIFPAFFEEFACFVPGKRRPQKSHQKCLPLFNAKSPGQFKDKIHKSFLASRQSRYAWGRHEMHLQLRQGWQTETDWQMPSNWKEVGRMKRGNPPQDKPEHCTKQPQPLYSTRPAPFVHFARNLGLSGGHKRPSANLSRLSTAEVLGLRVASLLSSIVHKLCRDNRTSAPLNVGYLPPPRAAFAGFGRNQFVCMCVRASPHNLDQSNSKGKSQKAKLLENFSEHARGAHHFSDLSPGLSA